MVAPIDDREIDGRRGERLCGSKPGEPATDNDDFREGLGRHVSLVNSRLAYYELQSLNDAEITEGRPIIE
jgi:hypothetical protein